MKIITVKGSVYFLMLSVFITGCSKHQTPINKRVEMSLLSKVEEMNIGEKEYKKLMSCTVLCKDEEKKKAINRVGDKLISAVRHSHIKHWEFILVDKDSLNAVCLPNGKIFINNGIFKVAKNDDQLATVLAHEMSHAIARHGGARLSRNTMLLSHGDIAILNRLQEKEADEIGLKIMKKAGYDINESINFWKNMKVINKHKGRTHTHTHVSYDQRIKDIKKAIVRLEKKNL